MAYVIVFIVISTITGFLITYFLDAKSTSNNRQSSINTPRLLRSHPSQEGIQLSIIERLTYGVVIGLGLSTWLVYLFSMIFGLQFKCVLISLFLLITFCSLFLIIRWSSFKWRVLNEIVELKKDFLKNKLSYFVHFIIFCFFATIFWRLFYRTIIWHNGEMFIGLPNNYGDLPLHLSYITSFVWGDNIPPQDPSFAGEKLAYPILSDFLSAIFLKLGLGFKEILFIPGFLLTIVFYGVLYYFVYRLTKKRIAAIVSEFVFFFSGGFGFCYFFIDAWNASNGIWQFLTHLPRDYTKITSLNYHWITPLTCLNVPQRSLLFGFPITILIFSILYTGIERRRQRTVYRRQRAERCREFIFAGIIAGALPFFHTHSFMAILMVTIPLAIVFWDWRKWFLFFFPAFILSLPQILYFSTHVKSETFFKLNLGWMAGNENILWFWLKNTGLFWIVYIGGFVALFNPSIPPFRHPPSPLNRGEGGVGGIRNPQLTFVYFSLSFLVLFFLPNILLFAPWKWDNIKLLIYWFLGSVPLVAIVLSSLYENERHKIVYKVVFFLIMFFLTITGAIDVFKYAVAPIKGWKEFSHEEVELARRISVNTEPDAVFLNAPVHNHVVFLSGRKTVMGYPGHIWSHGYKDYTNREQDIRKILQGNPMAIELIDKYGPDYVTVGPHERRIGVNKRFFDINYECIMTSENYHVYDLNKKLQISAKDTMESERDLIAKGHGLSVDYYPNMRWEGEPISSEVQIDVAFNWPDEDLKPVKSPFSSVWKGYIDILRAGKYTFKLISDDGSWLYIDDKMLIDNGGYHAIKSATGTVNLQRGKHKIMIKYFDGGGGAVMQLLWIPPGGDEAKIPAENLYYKKIKEIR